MLTDTIEKLLSGKPETAAHVESWMPGTPPMTDAEFIADYVRALQDSVDYFGSKNKTIRERWVTNSFLRALRLRFAESDIRTAPSDPPDTLFRDARFEIKEELAGRLRHKEFKAALNRALKAKNIQDLVEGYTPRTINPREIGALVLENLPAISAHYAPAVKDSLDLLFYVNLPDRLFKDGSMPGPKSFTPFGWRSVSVFDNYVGLVFYAASPAPRFLKRHCGRYSRPRVDAALADGI